MKASFCFAFAAYVLRLVPVAKALTGTLWSIKDAPSEGLGHISFPITIARVDPPTEYIFAQQFAFIGAADIGYIGLQSLLLRNGSYLTRALFTSLVPGTTTNDTEHCYTLGPDGGAGVECVLVLDVSPWPISDMKHMLWVTSMFESTWFGKIDVDTDIGSFILPAGVGKIQSSQMGIVDWSPGYSTACESLSYQETIFGYPIPGQWGLTSTQQLAFETGGCVGRMNFSTKVVPDVGIQNSFGFIKPAEFQPPEGEASQYVLV